tara:strand:- start:7445 stop:8047 length:603 start_codon:yes stop_codon:yes gene_type:complete
MRAISDYDWESKFRPKIEAVLVRMSEMRKHGLSWDVRGYMRLFTHNLNVAEEYSGLRAPLVQMMRSALRRLEGTEQLCYIMGARTRLPYEVAATIDEICSQVAQEHQALFETSEWMFRIALRPERIYNERTGNWERAQTTMGAEDYSSRIYAKWNRKLTQWFKQGIWDGTKDHLGTRELLQRIVELKSGAISSTSEHYEE